METEQASRQRTRTEDFLLQKFMDWIIEVELSESRTPSNSDTILVLLPLRNEFGGLGEGEFFLLISQLFAACDSSVALWSLDRGLPTGQIKAADHWNRS